MLIEEIEESELCSCFLTEPLSEGNHLNTQRDVACVFVGLCMCVRTIVCLGVGVGVCVGGKQAAVGDGALSDHGLFAHAAVPLRA